MPTTRSMRSGSPRSPRPSSPRSPKPAPRRDTGASSPRPSPPGSQRDPPAAAPAVKRPSAKRPPLPRARSGSASERSDAPEVPDSAPTTARSSESGGGDTQRDGSPRRRSQQEGKSEAESRVRVAARVRPPVRQGELQEDDASGKAAIQCSGQKLWLLEPARDGAAAGASPTRSPRQFVFDWAMPPGTTQEEVYASVCDETAVVRGALEGINGCVMCYGQTGAGKTYTLGNMDAGNEGIVCRALTEVLATPEETVTSREVRLSYVATSRGWKLRAGQ